MEKIFFEEKQNIWSGLFVSKGVAKRDEVVYGVTYIPNGRFDNMSAHLVQASVVAALF
jgi:hypothetical protein